MSVLVTPTDTVPMSAVAAAALAQCGRDRIWLDTGATLHGIRVPDEASAAAVRAQAELLARAADATTENGLTITPAAEETGRPGCGEQAAQQLPDGDGPTPPAAAQAAQEDRGVSPMATECPSLVRGNVLRVTRLNGCGQPVYGENNQVVSDGFVTIKMSPEVEEGEEVNVVKANGKTCVSDKPCDQLKWYTVEYEFCEVDPDLLQIMNPTWEKILDNQGDTCGIDAIGELDCSMGYGLELWMDVYGGTDACVGQEADGVWGYMLLPYNVGGAPGDFEVGNEGISFNLTGRTKIGSNWRRGPYNVTLGDNNVPSPLLKPVTKKTHFQLFTTVVRPPVPECGAQPVDRPTPEKADLKITGIPNEEPRRTVRLFVDNHGFGPVLIDWGDGTSREETIEGRWVNHVYGSDGEYTITVRDKQTPVVKTSTDVTVPLPADEPKIKLSCADSETTPLKVLAKVTMPPHSDGRGRIDWGDGSEPEEFDASGASGTVANLTHTYPAPSIYTVSVRRLEQEKFRARDAVMVPCDGDGDGGPGGELKVSADADPADKSGRTVVLTIGRGDGDGGGEGGPQVKVSADKADESGRTAVVTIGDDSDGGTPTPTPN